MTTRGSAPVKLVQGRDPRGRCYRVPIRPADQARIDDAYLLEEVMAIRRHRDAWATKDFLEFPDYPGWKEDS